MKKPFVCPDCHVATACEDHNGPFMKPHGYDRCMRAADQVSHCNGCFAEFVEEMVAEVDEKLSTCTVSYDESFLGGGDEIQQRINQVNAQLTLVN